MTFLRPLSIRLFPACARLVSAPIPKQKGIRPISPKGRMPFFFFLWVQLSFGPVRWAASPGKLRPTPLPGKQIS